MLSDKVLLSQVARREVLLLSHEVVGFPSWWVHRDMFEQAGNGDHEGQLLRRRMSKGWENKRREREHENSGRASFRSFDVITSAEAMQMETERVVVESMLGVKRQSSNSHWQLEGSRQEVGDGVE